MLGQHYFILCLCALFVTQVVDCKIKGYKHIDCVAHMLQQDRLRVTHVTLCSDSGCALLSNRQACVFNRPFRFTHLRAGAAFGCGNEFSKAANHSDEPHIISSCLLIESSFTR